MAPKGDGLEMKVLAIIIAATLLKILLVHVHPLYLDECLYAEMIDEQLEKPSLMPTYLGYPTTWKPPLFFWAYALPTAALKVIIADIELAYRLPGILLGALNIWLVFLIMRKIAGEKPALYATLFYALCPIVAYTELRLLIDPLAGALVFGSIYLSLDQENQKGIWAGAALAFLAALTKSLVALVIPVAIFAHWAGKGKISLGRSVPLAAAPFGVLAGYGILAYCAPHLAQGEIQFDLFERVFGEDMLNSLGLSYANAFGFGHALLIFAALGFWNWWRKEPLMSAWFALLAFPLLGSQGMAWYFYIFVPVLAYFAVLGLGLDRKSGKEIYDDLFKFVVACILVLDLAALFLWYFYVAPGLLGGEKEIGLFLIGKENAVFIGDYQPTVTAIAYKTLNERMLYGKYLDFGWVITDRNETSDARLGMALDFAKDYHTDKYPVDERDFASLFWVAKNFRLPANVSEPDYWVIGMPNATRTWEGNFTVEGYRIIMEGRQAILVQK